MNVNQQRREYFIEEIPFDEYSKERILIGFQKFSAILSSFNLNLKEDVNDDSLKSIPKPGLQLIKDLKDEVEKFNFSYPKLRYAYESNTLNAILKKIDKHLDYCTASYIRVNTELQKMYAREKDLALIVPYSEFKASADVMILNFSAKNFDEVDYLNLYVQALFQWLVSKGKINLNQSNEALIESLKVVNSKVFNWGMERLFASSILKKFDVNISPDKSYWKSLVKKTDTLGKRMGIDSTEFILFEASLSKINSSRYANGKKFRYPDETGLEYLATSKHIVNDYSINLPLSPKVRISFPVHVAMLKAKSPTAVKN